jgi:beta-lactamase class D
MHRTILLTLALAACSSGRAPDAPPTATPSSTPARPEPAIDHPGCFMISRADGSEATIVHPEECAVATVPASTFKIPHALIALQLGVVTDPDALEKWDGTKYWNDAWHRDHSLRTGIRDSVVWFFQRLAPKIGKERMEEWLAKMHYGNADASGPIQKFWLDGGSLKISGDEQLAFMQQMFAGTLPIDAAHVETVKEIVKGPIDDWKGRLPEGATPPATTATFRAKTGTDSDPKGNVTWWVGAVEGPKGTWVFVSRVRAEGEPSSTSPAVHEGMRALAAAGVL